MRRGYLICLLVYLLTGCSIQNVEKKEESNSYFIQDTNFEIEYVEVLKDSVYHVQDEWDLAKFIQMRYEKGFDKSYFQCNKDVDLNLTSDYLTHIYPFDIKLTLESASYTNEKKQTTSYQQITIFNMDPFYEDAVAYVKQNIHEVVLNSMNITQKIEAIHDYLVMHVTYDKTQLVKKNVTSNVFLAYGALFERKAVCAGYARAFMMYARELQIPCVLITSKVIDHAWNMVYDGKDWRYVDTTWDDADDGHIDTLYRNKLKEDFYADEKHIVDANETSAFYNKIGKLFFGY